MCVCVLGMAERSGGVRVLYLLDATWRKSLRENDTAKDFGNERVVNYRGVGISHDFVIKTRRITFALILIYHFCCPEPTDFHTE